MDIPLFACNIRLLRTRRRKTQDLLASALDMPRPTLNSYENGSIKNPTLKALLAFSNYFCISIDTLIRIDLQKLSEFDLSELERGNSIQVYAYHFKLTDDKTQKVTIQ